MAEITDRVDVIREESKIITTEVLEAAIRSKEGNDLKVTEFTVKRGCKEGENYSSVAFSVTATVVNKNGEKNSRDLFIKTAFDKLWREWTFIESKVFLKEIKMYSELIPDMTHYQNERGMEQIGPSVPKFYYGVADNPTGIVILEDVRPKGYQMPDLITGLNYEHCKLVMTELAAFHALSYALKNGSLENLKKYDFVFHESLFVKEIPQYFQKIFDASVGIIKLFTRDNDTIQRVEKLREMDLLKTFREHVEPKEPYAVICHGDVWCNNILFTYDNAGAARIPTDVKFVDLQMVRYALPSTDLVYFFYTSTTRNTRKKHLRELLRIYHNAFSDFLRKLGVDFVAFSLDELEKMFAQSILYGVLWACFQIPYTLSQFRCTTDFTDHTEAEIDAVAESYLKQIVEADENMSLIKEQLLGVIEEAMEWGVI